MAEAYATMVGRDGRSTRIYRTRQDYIRGRFSMAGSRAAQRRRGGSAASYRG